MSQRNGIPEYAYPVLTGSGLFNQFWYNFLGDERSYESAEIAISSGSTTSLIHNLTARPRTAYAVLRCKTAEYGYAAGEEIAVPVFLDGANDRGAFVSADSTSLRLIVGADGISIIRRDTYVFGTITNGNWRLIVRAWL